MYVYAGKRTTRTRLVRGLNACMCRYICISCMHVCIHAHKFVRKCVSSSVSMYVCKHICMFVRMYVCMHASMQTCKHA